MITNYLNLPQVPLSFPDKGVVDNINPRTLSEKNIPQVQSQANLSRVITEEITLDSRPKVTGSPVLNAGSGRKPTDFGLTITDLIFLLKKLDQIAIKQSAEGMVNAQASVGRKAASIRQEGVLNCAAAATGGAVQMAVMGASFGLSNRALKKQQSVEGLDNKAKKDGLDQLAAQKDNNIESINKNHNQSMAQLDLKKDEAFGFVDSQKLKDNRDRLIKNENDNFEQAKTRLEADGDTLSNANRTKYLNIGSDIEKYRTYGQLSHAMGNIASSSIAVGSAEERAKSSLAEMDSSVDNKVTDNHRERSNNFKSTASELINSINRILENISNTVGDIVRKC